MKILVINGPNLNLLGLREPAIYGSQSYAALLEKIQAFCDAEGVEVSFFQSNHEGAIVDEIQAAYGVYDGIVINPAAYTHTSVAILDALAELDCKKVYIMLGANELGWPKAEKLKKPLKNMKRFCKKNPAMKMRNSILNT